MATPFPVEHYLNPNYWDGHTLGHGEIHPNPIRDSARAPFRNYFARKAAQRQYAVAPFTIRRTLLDGEAFDAREHAPGTVLWLGEERLLGVPSGQSLDTLAALPLPEKRSQITPPRGSIFLRDTVDSLDEYRATNDRTIIYSRQTFLGVVPRFGRENAINMFAASSLVAKGFNLDFYSTAVRYKMPRRVGDVQHHRLKSGECEGERLLRVNVIHILQNVVGK